MVICWNVLHNKGIEAMIDVSFGSFPYVSVIIPVYNNQSGIDTCIKALLEQTWPKNFYEIIVVDNGSVPPIQVNLPCEILNLVTCLTPGAYSARNTGIAKSRGKVFAFTDADCVPAADWIETGVSALNHVDGQCIIGGEVIFSLSQQPTTIERYQYLFGFMQRENIEKLGFAVTANLFVTRSQIEQVGLFDKRLFSGGDLEWCWRAKTFGFSVVFGPNVKVSTQPRRSLLSAIRQVRRVTGGRHALCGLKASHLDRSRIKPHRSGWTAIMRIFTNKELSSWNKGRVFVVALILKFSQVIERIRLYQGSIAERL